MITTMNKELKGAINTLTKGLSNPRYFEDTRPFEYSVGAYCLSCGKLGRDHVLEREWTSILLPRLKASSLAILRETGTRLEKEWKSQKIARQSERLELEEGMKMRRLLTRAKYEHREATLEHSSRTLMSDFQALDPIPIHPLSSSSACRTPPYIQSSSSQSSPEPSGCSPPAPPQLDMSKDAEDDASHAFFKSGGSLQDIVLDNLREGRSLPSWAKDLPSYTFELQLQDSWGPRVTESYNMARTKADLDHTHVDQIALLSGIVHLNQDHVGFSTKEIENISSEVLQSFYNQDMEDNDIQRAGEAVVLWTSWVQIWKSASLKEKLTAKKEARDVCEIDTEPVIDAIMSSYTDCKIKNILPIFYIALHVFRRYNNWTGLVSESDCMMAVVGPFLQEIMDVQHEIKFTCANSSTLAGRARKSSQQQDGPSRQPDVIGRARDAHEVFFGELKGLHPPLADVNTDLLRLAIFTKDALDQLHKILEQGPPLVTFQTVGRKVTFFLGAKVNNTVVHAYLSTVKLPSLLSELDLDLEFFFRLFQVQTIVAIANGCLKNKRDQPLQDIPFPTLGTPERRAALKNPQKNKTERQ